MTTFKVYSKTNYNMVNLLNLQKLIFYLYLNQIKETHIDNLISFSTFQPKIAVIELVFTKILTKEKNTHTRKIVL